MYWIVMKPMLMLLPIGRFFPAFGRGEAIREISLAERLVAASQCAVTNVNQTHMVVTECARVDCGSVAIPLEFLSAKSFADITGLYVLAQCEEMDRPGIDTLSMYNVHLYPTGSKGYKTVSLLDLADETDVDLKILARQAENMVFRFRDGKWSVAE